MKYKLKLTKIVFNYLIIFLLISLIIYTIYNLNKNKVRNLSNLSDNNDNNYCRDIILNESILNEKRVIESSDPEIGVYQSKNLKVSELNLRLEVISISSDWIAIRLFENDKCIIDDVANKVDNSYYIKKDDKELNIVFYDSYVKLIYNNYNKKMIINLEKET